MGAQPKNKITRVERGKRRAGNTPSLKKDIKTAKTPLYKQTLMKKFANSSAATQVGKTTQKTTSSKAAPSKPQKGAQPSTAKSTKSKPKVASSSTKKTPAKKNG